MHHRPYLGVLRLGICFTAISCGDATGLVAQAPTPAATRSAPDETLTTAHTTTPASNGSNGSNGSNAPAWCAADAARQAGLHALCVCDTNASRCGNQGGGDDHHEAKVEVDALKDGGGSSNAHGGDDGSHDGHSNDNGHGSGNNDNGHGSGSNNGHGSDSNNGHGSGSDDGHGSGSDNGHGSGSDNGHGSGNNNGPTTPSCPSFAKLVNDPNAATCPCDANQTSSIVALIGQAAQKSDDATAGADANSLLSVKTNSLSLAAGTYYFAGIHTTAPLKITATGPVQIYVGADIVAAGALSLTSTAGNTLDVYVAGNLIAARGLTFGRHDAPTLSHLYVAGTGVSLGTPSELDGELFAPLSRFSAAGAQIYGSVLVNTLASVKDAGLCYAPTLSSAGEVCAASPVVVTPPPVVTPPALPPGHCLTCDQCGGLTCSTGGLCTACDDATPCCSGRVCISGTCVPQ